MKIESKPFLVMFAFAVLTLALMFYSYRKQIIDAPKDLPETGPKVQEPALDPQ